jgi:hypothetical protein
MRGVRTGSASPGKAEWAMRLVVECKLDWLSDRGYLSPTQYRAGLKFRKAWLVSSLQHSVSARYVGATGGKSTSTLSDYQLDMRQAVDEALAILGPCQQTVVTDVCGEDQDVGSRMGTLRHGLDQLADYWGIKAREND